MQPSRGLIRILHLEDDPEDAALMSRGLASAGIEAQMTVASNRPEFVAALERGGFDLILSDHGLPAFTGLEALKLARKKYPDVGFICVSGTAPDEQVHNYLAAGATDYVLKNQLWLLGASVRREQARWHLGRMNQGMTRLVTAVQELSLARDLDTIMGIVRRAARQLTGADGATFILKDGEQCHYADEDAIAPLWKGRRFPLSTCISGWVMLHRQPAVIPDIYADARIPAAAYRPTFVKSLAVVPIRTEAPIGAIGNYWAVQRMPAAEEVQLLQALANTTAVALENVQVYRELEQRVTDRTLALQTANVELAAANRELESFSHAVSHDLGAPLRGIRGFADLLAKEYATRLDETGRNYLTRVQDNARRMGELMADLLRLSTVARTEIKRTKVDLSQVGRRIAAVLAANTPDRKVEIHIADGMEAEGDEGLLQIALENLLANAWKYTGKRKRARIEFGKTQPADGTPTYHVRDNGVGFSMEHAPRLFQPFQRLHNREDFPGSGIGLTTVQRIIHRHGGRIWAKAQRNKGAAFYFTLENPPAG